MPMAYMAVTEQLPMQIWWLYAANLCWTVAYDTMYAMVDRDDDVKIGVKSTAVFFGHMDRLAVGLLQIATLIILYSVGKTLDLSWIYNLSIVLAGIMFAYQQWYIRKRERDRCFEAFLQNNYVGMVIFLGIAGHFLIQK